MELPVSWQATQFALSLLLGICLGVVYDFFRALRRLAPRLTWLLDLLYVFLWLPTLLLFALYVGGGQLRLFMLSGLVLGGAVYFLTGSRIILPIFVWFFKLLFRPFSFLFRKILVFFSLFGKIHKIVLQLPKKSANIRKKAQKHRQRPVPAKFYTRKRGAKHIENTHQIS